MEIPVNRIFDLLPRYAQKFDPKDDVLAGKEKGVWKSIASTNLSKYPTTLVMGC